MICYEVQSFFLYLLQPPGGCKGMYLLDCKSLNHSNHVNDDHVKDHDNCGGDSGSGSEHLL